jgi:hypothetical protein
VDILARGWSPRLRDFGFVLLLSSFFVIGKKEDDTKTDHFQALKEARIEHEYAKKTHTSSKNWMIGAGLMEYNQLAR